MIPWVSGLSRFGESEVGLTVLEGAAKCASGKAHSAASRPEQAPDQESGPTRLRG